MKITSKDFATLESLIKSEVNRNYKNPTLYYSNLWSRAQDIIRENVDDRAKPVEMTRNYHY